MSDYQNFMNTIGYTNLKGQVSASMAVTLYLQHFPRYQPQDILKVMPTAYSQYVDAYKYPSVISPQEVARTIALGYQVMAARDKDNNLVYVTSYKEQYPYLKMIKYAIQKDQHYTEIGLLPMCCDTEQAWSKLIPWNILAKKNAKWTGDFLVFVDWSFQDYSITSKHYYVLPELQACVPIVNEAKL